MGLNGWEARKRKFLQRIERDSAIGYFDEEVKPLVETINSYKGMYTTSSCSGRIILLKSSRPWKKEESEVVRKWHGDVRWKELATLIGQLKGDLWLVLQSPIVHVMCRDVELAVKLVRLARSQGFRYSSIISKSNYGYLAELAGSERLDIPLSLEGERLLDDSGLKLLVNFMNKRLVASKKKIERLRSALISNKDEFDEATNSA